MSDFRFRLQRVLDYRQLVEGWAKDAFLEARAARLEAVLAIDRLDAKRSDLVAADAPTLADRRSLENCLEKLEADKRRQLIVIEDLQADEAKRKEEWAEARKAVQTLEKLRDRAFALWMKEENRREQKSLDEWSLQRRPA